jgi:hypothetical protein
MNDTAMKRWADAQTSVGKKIQGEAGRDAIHFAVAPVEAASDLWPGVHVGLDAYGRAARIEPKVGIVDPFLQEDQGWIKAGERFWLFLYPNTITSLRHVWEHPAFSKEAPVYADESEAYLRKLAAQVWDFGDEPVSYEEFLVILDKAAKGDGYCFGNDDGPGPVYAAQESGELWKHYERVTGKPGPRGEVVFRCSC